MEVEQSPPAFWKLPRVWLLSTPANFYGISKECESVSDRSLRKPADHSRSRSLLGIHLVICPAILHLLWFRLSGHSLIALGVK